ncbi:MAG: S8 family serine peptidase [Thermodesulfobacteriota bacterium]
MKRIRTAVVISLWICLLISMQPAAARAADPDSKAPEAPYVNREVLVKFRPGTAESDKDRVRNRFEAEVMKTVRSIGLEHWRLPDTITTDEALKILEGIPEVEHAEPNYLYTPMAIPNDPDFDRLWYLNNRGQTVNGTAGLSGADIAAPEAWDIATGSPDLVIAVIDSGVAFEHPDLIDNTWINPGEIPGNGIDDDGNGYVDDLYGWDFVNEDANPSDYSRDLSGDGHGTHVAGIIAAHGNNGRGASGVMWRAKIMALQIFDLFETSSFLDAIIQSINIISAIEYAVDNGARIINCSFGGPSPSQFQRDAFRYADENGVLAVAAAGNETNDNDRFQTYPAGYQLPNIISVAATDENDRLAAYSNFGATVDVAAPGGSIVSNIFSTVPPDRVELFSEDFESGDDRWIKEAVHERWSRVFDPEFGSWVMQDSEGDYANNENSYIQTRNPIDADNYRGLHIQFRSRFRLEENFDFLFIEGSTDGINFSIDFPVTGFVTGFSNGIERILGWGSEDELGDAFYLRFRLETDESRTFAGSVVDDIILTGIRWEFEGDEYGFKSGTSMAAPVVAGIAGLVWSHRPELTHLEVKNAVLNGAEPLAALEGRVLTGARVNAVRALTASTEENFVEPEIVAEEDGGGGGCFIESLIR